MIWLQEGKSKKGQLGPFDKKWLMISVQDLDVKQRDRGGEPLGRVVINLSDFAAEDGRHDTGVHSRDQQGHQRVRGRSQATGDHWVSTCLRYTCSPNSGSAPCTRRAVIQAFIVASSKAITAAVGEAKLLVTIGVSAPLRLSMWRNHVHLR